jgi:hypothetical protein
LRSAGYKFLLVIDGIDNLDYYKDGDLYKRLLEQMRDMAHNCRKTTSSDRIIFSLRSETYSHIHEIGLKLTESTDYDTFYIKSIDPQSIFSSRLKIACNPNSLYFKSNILRDLSIGVKSLNTFFETSLSPLLGDLKNAITEILPESALISKNEFNDNFLEILYNNNIRDILINSLNVFLYKKFFEQKKKISLFRNIFFLRGFC